MDTSPKASPTSTTSIERFLETELENECRRVEKSIKDLQNDLQITENEIADCIEEKKEKYHTQISLLQSKITDKEQEILDIQSRLNGIFQNTYENEFDYEECDYIKKEPIIHLDIEKALKQIYGITCHDLVLVYEFAKYERIETLLQLNFPINYALAEDEYIVKVFLINQNINLIKATYNSCNKNKQSYSFLYLSNFGRFISSENISFEDHKVEWRNNGIGYDKTFCKIKDIITIIHDGKCETALEKIVNVSRNCTDFDYHKTLWNYPATDMSPPSILPKLTYRMPRLFLDVITAFHTQNNDMMQECCKTYLEITRTKSTE